MRKVWLLLRAEAARWKSRKHIGFFIVLIVIMISTFCYVREQKTIESGKISLGVAKEDTSEYADLLLTYFNENEVFLQYVELIEESEETLRRALEQGVLDAYLVIPKDFAQSMIRMDDLPIRAAVSMKNPTKALVLRNVMDAYETYIEAVEVNCTALYRLMKEEGFSKFELNAANMEVSLELIFTALGKDELFRRRIVEPEVEAGISLAEHYKLTALYFVLLFAFLPAGLRVLELRNSGMTDRLRTMHVSKASLLTAVGIPYLLLAIAVLSVYAYLSERLNRLPEGLLLVLPWLLVLLCMGLLCDNSRNYLFLCSFGMVALAIVGGSLIPEEFLPDTFQKLASFLPNHKFIQVMGGVQP
ncbi:MAG: ABC transporter permease [Lachnospiraceae bacterium]|nr:ABC transporter permease [Lachnospiraceae bacterium]